MAEEQPETTALLTPPSPAPKHSMPGHRHGLSELLPFKFLQELKRRNVGRVAILYTMISYVALEAFELFFHLLEIPAWAGRAAVLLVVLGFPAALIFAWVYEITPEGLKPTEDVPPQRSIRVQTGRKLDRAIIAVLAIALTYFVVDKFWLSKHATTEQTSAPPASAPAVASPAATAVTDKSIAVLPFVDLSEKKDQQYFADGIAVAVLDLLARVPGLRVVAHNSSFQLKDKADDLRAIGAELGATYVVQGSVGRSGDQIRVAGQLIDTRDGSQRWSSTYNRKSGDIFEVQDAIAANLARTMQLTLGSDFSSRSSTSNAAAYDIYLRGLQALDQWSKAGAEEAAGDFQQALSLDPKFALAALGRAKAYRMLGVNVWLPATVAFEQAREAADLSLRLDAKLGEAHAVLGEIALTYDWNLALADREINQAMKLGGGIETLQAAARLAAVNNQWAQATGLFQTALAADPLNANLYVLLAWGVELRSGQFSEAEAAFRRALEISPGYGSARWTLGQALLFQNRLNEALDAMQHESPDNGQLEGTSIVYYAMGKKEQSDAWLKRAIAHDSKLYPSAIAKVFAYRGEREQAMKWLENAFAVKDGDLYFLRHEPLMKNLEGDPRYQAFLDKLNMPK